MNEKGEEERRDEIFGRSSVLMRSPVNRNQAGGSSMSNVSTGAEKVETPVCRSSFEKLGDKIVRLNDFMKGRSNIHKEIVSMIKEVHALYTLTKLDGSNKLDARPRSTASRTSQTEPCTSSINKVESKGTQTVEVFTAQFLGTPTQKRTAREMSPRNALRNAKKKKKDSPEEHTPKPAETTRKQKGNDKSEWQKVEKKRKKRKERRKTVRPDALIIRAGSEVSYADILKRVKADDRLSDLGGNVRRIKKSAKGDLILELTKSEHENLSTFREQVKDVLGKDAEVKSVAQEVTLDVRDIDEITTKEEIYEALIKYSDEMKSLQLSSIKSLRRAFGGTQVATIGLSAPLAKDLLEKGKIRIGWIMCRVRQKIFPKRCYKCLEFGHISINCRSPNDFSNCCIKCGAKGHKIRECKDDAKCLTCVDRKHSICHITGSGAFPKFKDAMKILKQRI